MVIHSLLNCAEMIAFTELEYQTEVRHANDAEPAETIIYQKLYTDLF